MFNLKTFFCSFGLFIILLQTQIIASNSVIHLTLEDCLFVKYPVPEKGIVCSNSERAMRLSRRLFDTELHQCAWGPFVIIGNYQGERIFVACASVGTGAGLLFTELYVAGAKYIIRYGSDDVKSPPKTDAFLVKIIDEADNLYGFNIQSGVDPQEWGKSISASSQMIDALVATAEKNGLAYETRICHHLENYHGLRNSDKFSIERSQRLKTILTQLNENSKPASYDMETAVLFRVAKDCGAHAATILQTVNKEDKKFSSYEGDNYRQAREVEELFFFNYVLDALISLPITHL